MFHARIVSVERSALHALPRTPRCLALPIVVAANTMAPSFQGIPHNAATAPAPSAATQPTRPAI